MVLARPRAGGAHRPAAAERPPSTHSASDGPGGIRCLTQGDSQPEGGQLRGDVVEDAPQAHAAVLRLDEAGRGAHLAEHEAHLLGPVEGFSGTSTTPA